MSVAIVHYHLRHGGVTRVIEAQSEALTKLGIDHVVLSGTPYEGDRPLPVVVVPHLDYRSEGEPLAGPEVAASLRKAAGEVLSRAPSLWHIHNPTLGKNDLFPILIRELAQSGQRILFQHHDFAEDGRSGNYALLAGIEDLYPTAPQIHSAFINSRDRDLLVAAGLSPERAHLLPNAVLPPVLPKDAAEPPASGYTVLYPVRGIRRKNLGEFCLLAGLAPEGTRFALTLAPANPQWQAVYNEWVAFAEQSGHPALFDVVGNVPPAPGVDPSFENWLAHATHLATTSIAEGFGLAFLEPLALGKPLFGRDLPEITADFTTNGLALGTLYEDFLIPLDWIDLEQLRRQLRRELEQAYAAYRQPCTDEHFDLAWDSLLLGDYADFGNLPETVQREVATHALEFPDEVMVGIDGECQPAVDWLVAALEDPDPSSDPAALAPYSIASYAERLRGVYDTLHADPPGPVATLPPENVLHQFLEPDRFHFLRT